MKREIVILSKAKDDMLEAWTYGSNIDSAGADRLINKLLLSFDLLAEWPGIGHIRADVKSRRYRFWPVKPYVVAYRYTKRTLTIVRVLHGARDFRQQF